MAIKPLKDLLAQADRFLGNDGSTKLASASEGDAIFKLAESLAKAESIEGSHESSIDKIAMALNRASALVEIEQMQKISQFMEKASASGYTPEQIDESLEKLAATQVKKNLLQLLAFNGEDENALPKKPVVAKAQGQGARQFSLTRGLG